MNCKTCHEPIHPTRDEEGRLDDGWGHDALNAILRCPADEVEPEGGMFDMLTRNELHELHHTLCSQYNRQHHLIMGLMNLSHDDITGLLASPAFKVLDASHREVDEMADEVFAELKARDVEAAEMRELTRDA